MIHLGFFTYAGLQYLFLIPLFVLLFSLVVYCFIRQKYIVNQLAAPAHRFLLVRNFVIPKKISKVFLCAGAFGALCIAFLRPQKEAHEVVIHQEGRDVLIVLDVSRSMLAQDVAPYRLAYAKKKIESLVQALACDRVGLMLFSGTAVVQCPLTQDHHAFFMFLQGVDVETISSGTTALDQALKKSLNVFERIPTKKHKLVIVLTDGEDFSTDFAEIKKQVIEKNIRIFTLGVGTQEGAPIPLYDENGNLHGHQRDDKENVVITRLRPDLLRSLSHDSGGTYIQATSDSQDITKLVTLVEHYEKERFDEKKFSVGEDVYYYFTAIAGILLLLEWLL